MQKRHWAMGVMVCLGLSACGNSDDAILQGERLDLKGGPIEPARGVSGDGRGVEVQNNTAPAFRAADAAANRVWAYKNGSAGHNLTPPPALAETITSLWSVDIGQGNDTKHKITSPPIVGDTYIYVIDGAAQVSAVGKEGDIAWSQSLIPQRENGDTNPGGGLSYADGQVFITDGYGVLTALDGETGQVIWRQNLNSVAGSPTVYKGIVYVAAHNGIGWAIDVKTGRVLWTISAAPSAVNIIGGPAPAVSDTMVVFTFASGEVTGVFRQGGIRRWVSNVNAAREFQVYSRISDLTADPVIAGDRVYVSNQSGVLVALSLETGQRIWTTLEGSYSPVWVAGGSVFIISDLNTLWRLDAKTGRRIWAISLPLFVDPDPGDRKAIYSHYGPLLAGDLLWVVSSDGDIRAFNPQTGEMVSKTPISGGGASSLAIAEQVAYVLSADGQLHAFR